MSPNVGHIAPIIGSEAPKSSPAPIIATMVYVYVEALFFSILFFKIIFY